MAEYENNQEDFFEMQDDWLEEEKKESRLWGILRGGVALLVVVALIYISGISQVLFYRRTPATIEQEMTTRLTDAEVRVVPLVAFVVKGDEELVSERDEEDIRRIVENASRIWEQAGINLTLYDIQFVNSEVNTVERVISATEKNPHMINVFFVKYLGGINGIAFVGTRSVAVADYTTVYDFRVLAHEVGHILGLRHVEERDRLMFQGANGYALTLEEIDEVRHTVIRMFPH
jgi:predicted Zn-dependent protease